MKEWLRKLFRRKPVQMSDVDIVPGPNIAAATENGGPFHKDSIIQMSGSSAWRLKPEPSPARIVNLGEGSFGVEYSYGERPAPSWLTKEEPMTEKRKGPRKTAIRLLEAKMRETERLPRGERHILQALTTVSMSIAAMDRSVEAYRRVQNNLLTLAAMVIWRSGDDGGLEEAVARWYAHRETWADDKAVSMGRLTRAVGWAFSGWEHGYDADARVPIIICLEWASRLEKAIRWMER